MAKAAGVSVATVSRVLNNHDNVSEKTAKKVLKVADEMGFELNILGRNLRCQETMIILVMLNSIANTFCANVIRSIEREANENGYNIMICATNGSIKREQVYINYVRNRLADGMIILSSELTAAEMKKLSKHYAIVQCNEYVDTKTTPFVSINNKQAAYEATELLVKNGRKRIVFMGVENDYISTKDRFSGYKKALSDNSIEFDSDLVVNGNYSYRNGITVTEEFIKRNISFDGIFAISDRMAAGAITALLNNGIKVPEDVEVIGFDNTDISYIMTPSVTTVAQPRTELGKTAFKLLLNKIKGEPCENVILNHKLIINNSTRKR